MSLSKSFEAAQLRSLRMFRSVVLRLSETAGNDT